MSGRLGTTAWTKTPEEAVENTPSFNPETVTIGLDVLVLVEAETVVRNQFQRSWISPCAPFYV